MRKLFLILLSSICLNAFAQEDSINVELNQINVNASRIPFTFKKTPRLVNILNPNEIKNAPVASITDLLEYSANIDMRQRGESGIQSDLSLRGGNFDQVSILLNGINISSPHTGHLSADFPLSILDIERIEVIEGPSARVFGTSAFAGVVNVVSKNESKKNLVKLEAGDFGTFSGDIRISQSHNLIAPKYNREGAKMYHHLSLGYGTSNGATQNSAFDKANLFYQNHVDSKNATVDAQLGISYKEFEANTFYSALSTDQWESNQRIIASLKSEIKSGIWHFMPIFNFNRWYDHYQWHKGTNLGANFHQVDTYTGAFNSWFEAGISKTSIGFEIRNEGILSTKLGEPLAESCWEKTRGFDKNDTILYKFGTNRSNISAFLEEAFSFEKLTISLGVLANLNTALDSKWRFYPGIDMSYFPSDHFKICLSYNQALRMPTFTDLYYSGVGIEGNSNLKPEKTKDLSLSAIYQIKGLRANATVFYSHKTDMIDWVRYQNDTSNTFRSGNFKLDNLGYSVNAKFLPAEIINPDFFLQRLEVQYSYMDLNADYIANAIYGAAKDTKATFEYLKHKVVASADFRIINNLNFNIAWRYQERTGENNKSYNLADMKLSWKQKLKNNTSYMIYADCTNVFDKKYADYAYIPQPGRWFKMGVILEF